MNADTDIYVHLAILCFIVIGIIISTLVIDRCVNKCFDKPYYAFTTSACITIPYAVLLPFAKSTYSNPDTSFGIMIIVYAWTGILIMGSIIICFRKRHEIKEFILCTCCNKQKQTFNRDSDQTQIDEHYDYTHFNPNHPMNRSKQPIHAQTHGEKPHSENTNINTYGTIGDKNKFPTDPEIVIDIPNPNHSSGHGSGHDFYQQPIHTSYPYPAYIPPYTYPYNPQYTSHQTQPYDPMDQ